MYKILSAAAVIAMSLSGGAQASPLAASLAQISRHDLALTTQAQTQPTTPARRRAQQPRRPQTPAQPRQPQQQQQPAGGGLIPG